MSVGSKRSVEEMSTVTDDEQQNLIIDVEEIVDNMMDTIDEIIEIFVDDLPKQDQTLPKAFWDKLLTVIQTRVKDRSNYWKSFESDECIDDGTEDQPPAIQRPAPGAPKKQKAPLPQRDYSRIMRSLNDFFSDVRCLSGEEMLQEDKNLVKRIVFGPYESE